MDNESPDFNLTEGQKSRLFGLGLVKPLDRSTDTDGQKTDMLYDILTSRLPVDSSVADSLPGVVKDLCPSLNSIAGETIGGLLQDPHAKISTLKRIKWYAKESGTSVESEAQKDAYLVVYYGAIASALLCHRKKITQHPYGDLQEFLLSISQEVWVLEEIRALFRKAHIHCERIADESEGPNT